MSLRVVQWTTGNVGRRALRAIAQHPALELIGVFAHASDKIGRDAGELCGLPPLGVRATSDVAALLALHPDCISYNPLWPSVDELVLFLQAGVNVVTTAAFVTGWGLGEEARSRIERAASVGGASIFGSGMNPGFANLLALVSAGICERVDKIVVTESVDATGYTSAATQQSVGFGHPITKPELPQMVERGTRVFGDAVAMMADALAVELESIRCEPEFAVATQDMDLGFMKIDQGCVAGVKAAWHGVAHGRSAIELRVVWKMGKHMQPDWKLEHGYGVEIDGSPRVRTRLQILPPHGFEGKSFEDFMVLGMIATALPAVHAIPAVCAARPGIVSYAELPLVTAAHCVR